MKNAIKYKTAEIKSTGEFVKLLELITTTSKPYWVIDTNSNVSTSKLVNFKK